MLKRATLSALFALILILTSTARAVEPTWEYSVQVSSAVQASPAQITLSWPQDVQGVPNGYTISRKAPGASSWSQVASVSGSTTSWTDTSVSVGTAYEYRVTKSAGGYTGYGYIQTGINAPLVDSRGKVILIVDNTLASGLASELARLQQDLVGDGWAVVRHDVARTDSPASVKALIAADYNADRANVKSVFLFGHVPVPYSGQLNPDGHPDHVGAWPADVYYGDVDGSWTDNSVNYTQSINTQAADAARLTNRPGDGKFDQTDIPSGVELAVGRVDLSSMPGRVTWGGPATFPSELELHRNYLNKDHNFRTGSTNTPRRAILGDYFGVRGGEAFAASGFRSFAPLVGAGNIRNLNTEFNDQRGVWVTQAAGNDYLLAYGCGAGSYQTIAGLGNTGQYNDIQTSELVSKDDKGVFNLLFGSWLGDWDNEDNVLRAPLATSRGLVSVWSGRPHWFLHPMGQGETIGYVAQLVQNNTSLYETAINSSSHRIHIALMGDPTLRLHPVKTATNLNGTIAGSTATLAWSASTDSGIVGYHVYRASSSTAAFTRLTSSPITALNYTDTSASSSAIYMVRAVKLENTTSGSYYNASQGIFWSQSGGSVGGTTSGTVASTNTSGSTSTTTSGSTTTTSGSTSTTSSSGSTSTTTSSGSTTTASGSTTTATTVAGTTLWFDDALPTGAGAGSSGGDSWNWVTSSPAPLSGTKAHQSSLGAGLHEHFFNWATPLSVGTGEVLVTYVYLDPSNMPSEIMLSFASANWEHRAYWGADKIDYGTRNTAGRYNMGALPAGGQWVRLEVPASALGLEGQQVVGMCFSTFDGRATFDATGKAAAGSSSSTNTSANTSTSTASSSTSTSTSSPTNTSTSAPTTSTTTSVVTDTLWFDDDLPRGAGAGGSGGDGWNWVSSSPTPASGLRAHQTNLASGLHEHFFNWASQTMKVATGDKLIAYVYLDPANPPTEIMLNWCADNWEHRAYWGANKINYGTNNTAGRYYAGALPATGQWVRLEVAASAVGLEGKDVQGICFSTFDGRATYDKVGTATVTTVTASTSGTSSSTTTTPSTSTSTTTSAGTEFAWIDDALPAGATGIGNGETWNWVTSSPAPQSGSKAHQSANAAGLHEHYFAWGATMSIATGDTLYAYVYIDPSAPTQEIMLSWNDGSWEHRAYWGADKISYGTANTAGRYRVGALPAAGGWVRLEVPASAVGLEGKTVTAMCFSTFDGRVTYDKAGKITK